LRSHRERKIAMRVIQKAFLIVGILFLTSGSHRSPERLAADGYGFHAVVRKRRDAPRERVIIFLQRGDNLAACNLHRCIGPNSESQGARL